MDAPIYFSLPENMFLYLSNGDMVHEVYTVLPDLNGDLWLNNIKVGHITKGVFTPLVHHIPELYYWFHYTCTITRTGLNAMKCVFYRKIIINNVETIFPGKFPQQADIVIGLSRYTQLDTPPLSELTVEFNLIKLNLMFMLSIYRLHDTIVYPEAEILNQLFDYIIHQYLTKLDESISRKIDQAIKTNEEIEDNQAVEDRLARMLLTQNYSALKNQLDRHTNLILPLIIKYADIVLPHTPRAFFVLLKHKNAFRPFRNKILVLAKKYQRDDLAHLSKGIGRGIPSPLRQVNDV